MLKRSATLLKKNKFCNFLLCGGLALAAFNGFGPSLLAKTNEKELKVRNELEQTMIQAREAIINKDYEQFIESIDPLKTPDQPTKEKWVKGLENERVLKIILDAFPDLTTETRFLSLKLSEDWAVYYCENHLDEKDYLTVSAFVFHLVKGRWLVYGNAYGLIKARPGSEAAKKGFAAWSGESEIMETIKTDPKFQLESLVKKTK